MDDGLDLNDLTADLARAAEAARQAAATAPEEQLELVREHCSQLVARGVLTPVDLMIMVRAYCEKLSLSVRDAELQEIVAAAVRASSTPIFYGEGDRLQADDPSFLVDGLIRSSCQNLIVGQPKVGKSSFVAGLVSALRDRRDSFVGCPINHPDREIPVLIFGTDQQEGDWLYYLRRERLVTDDKALVAPLKFFCSVDAQDHFNFTPGGVAAMKAQIDRFQNPLVIIDSLSSMMEPTGIEEGLGQYGGMIRSALKGLSQNGATIIVLHHTTKVVTTWDWVEECRGGTRLSSIPGWGVLMRWLTTEEHGTMRMDRRVGFIGKGRGSGTGKGTLAEYTNDHGWVSHGDLDEAQRVERMKHLYLELQGVRMTVMDAVVTAHEMGRATCAPQIGTEINKTTSHVARELTILKGMGLIEVDRKEQTGARPRVYWRLSRLAQVVVQLTHDPSANPAPGHGSSGSFGSSGPKPPIEPKEPKKSSIKGGTAVRKEPTGLPPTNTPVERCVEGVWSNGWKLHPDTSHPDAVIIWTEMKGRTLIARNLRWGLDVRLCQAPTLPAPLNLDDLPF